jgi:hypothetical protein
VRWAVLAQQARGHALPAQRAERVRDRELERLDPALAHELAQPLVRGVDPRLGDVL